MRSRLRESSADSEVISAAVDGWLGNNPAARTIAVFAALPGEVDLTAIVSRHDDRKWAYPRVNGEELDFYHVKNPITDLQPGHFGIREPSVELPLIALAEIDAFLCPGLAFDSRGGRLGRGRGFYDRTLAQARPQALKVGICFQWQIVPDTFPQAHDIPMDKLIYA